MDYLKYFNHTKPPDPSRYDWKEEDREALIDLEDYLLEIFDKYCIIKTEYEDQDIVVSNYYIDPSNSSPIGNYAQMKIETFGKLHPKRVLDDINRIKPTIEKRLGQEIWIRHSNHFIDDWEPSPTSMSGLIKITLHDFDRGADKNHPVFKKQGIKKDPNKLGS